MSTPRTFIYALATVFALAMSGDALARAGGGGSFGSRGSHTFSSPPSTMTAPRAAPIQRSMTPAPGFPGRQMGASGGFFSGGLGRGLLGGFIGAGIFGLLFGHGLFGGLGGGMSIIGLLLQIGLLVLVFKLVSGWLRGRQQPAYQGAAYSPGPIQGGPQPTGGYGTAPTGSTRLDLQAADFTTFEQRLGEVQTAYGAENLEVLRRIVTPEMASYFAEEIAGNARNGQINRLSDIRLLHGDPSELWREGAGDFATVAMRYSLLDTMVDRASGRVVGGDPSTPQTVTEVWTFTRPSYGSPADWKLSAIQQA